MVVEVFIAEADSEDTLRQHGFLLMNDEKLITRIGNAAVDRIN